MRERYLFSCPLFMRLQQRGVVQIYVAHVEQNTERTEYRIVRSARVEQKQSMTDLQTRRHASLANEAPRTEGFRLPIRGINVQFVSASALGSFAHLDLRTDAIALCIASMQAIQWAERSGIGTHTERGRERMHHSKFDTHSNAHVCVCVRACQSASSMVARRVDSTSS